MKMKEFELGQLFKVKSSKQIYHANTLPDIKDTQEVGTFPYVVRSTQNNGIRGYIKEDVGNLNSENSLSFAQDTFTVFYQEQPYFTGNKVKVLEPKCKFNREIALYIIGLLDKALSDYTWGICSDVKFIEKIKLILPVKPVFTPDYALIENLARGGIDMSNINTSTWKEFSLDELFEISTTKSQNKNAITFDYNGIYDFIGRSSVNYGIQGHLNRQEYEPNPAKVFSLVQVGESVCLYRENEWYASQNIFMLKPKDDRICAAHNFFETLINKQLSIYTSAYIYPCLEDVKKIKILLPCTETEEIDFDFMEKYIRAIEKQTIARVYEGRGKIIEKTKEIVSQKTI